MQKTSRFELMGTPDPDLAFLHIGAYLEITQNLLGSILESLRVSTLLGRSLKVSFRTPIRTLFSDPFQTKIN